MLNAYILTKHPYRKSNHEKGVCGLYIDNMPLLYVFVKLTSIIRSLLPTVMPEFLNPELTAT